MCFDYSALKLQINSPKQIMVSSLLQFKVKIKSNFLEKKKLKKLSIYLRARGFNTYSLSTDDYFLDRKDTPRDENGEYDFEILEAIDLNLFNKHMTKLLDGEKVLLP